MMEPTDRVQHTNQNITNRDVPPLRRTYSFIVPPDSSQQRRAVQILGTDLTQTSIYRPSHRLVGSSTIHGQPINGPARPVTLDLIAARVQELQRSMIISPDLSQMELMIHLATTEPFRAMSPERIRAFLIGLGQYVANLPEQSREEENSRVLMQIALNRFQSWDQDRQERMLSASNNRFRSSVQTKGYFTHITHEIAPQAKR